MTSSRSYFPFSSFLQRRESLGRALDAFGDFIGAWAADNTFSLLVDHMRVNTDHLSLPIP